MYIAAAGLDPWRDCAIVLAEELEKVGGKARLDVYPGMPHVWWTTFYRLKSTQRWLGNTLDGVRWLLEQGGTAKL